MISEVFLDSLALAAKCGFSPFHALFLTYKTNILLPINYYLWCFKIAFHLWLHQACLFDFSHNLLCLRALVPLYENIMMPVTVITSSMVFFTFSREEKHEGLSLLSGLPKWSLHISTRNYYSLPNLRKCVLMWPIIAAKDFSTADLSLTKSIKASKKLVENCIWSLRLQKKPIYIKKISM